MLIENTIGDFPVWLAPLQSVVIPISENQNEVAGEFYQLLKSRSIRTELNLKSDTMGAKIREAELMKVPYMFIIGEREAKDKKVSIRRRKSGDKGVCSWDEAIEMIETEIVQQ